MYKGVVFRFLSTVILLVFTYTSCSNPFFNCLPNEANTFQVEIGKGNPCYVYLDSEYNPITYDIDITNPDPGKTAILIDDNPMAEGVMALAETLTNGNVVRLINKSNDSVISMFFDSNNIFPSSFFIKLGEEYINAFLSDYNYENQHYSITFVKNEDVFTLNDVIMNKAILESYENNKALTDAQNIRIRSIYTALGLYASLYNVLPLGTDIFLGFLDVLKTTLKVIFACVAVIAFCVAIVYTAPIVIGSISIIIPTFGSLTSLAGLGVASAAVLCYRLVDLIPGDPSSEPENKNLFVSIHKKDNINGDFNKIDKNAEFYIGPNSNLNFNIVFSNRKYSKDDEDIQFFFYDPCKKSYFPSNYDLLKFQINGDNPNYSSDFLPSGDVKISVLRNNFVGYINCGYIYFCLYFTKQVPYVNDDPVGIETLLLSDGSEIKGLFYIFKISLAKENERIPCGNH